MKTLTLKIRKFRDRPDTHDKEWMWFIISWTGERGISLKDQVRWQKLAAEVVDLDENKEHTISLSNKTIEAIEARIVNPDFKVMGMSPLLMQFIVDLKESLGLRISTSFEEDDS